MNDRLNREIDDLPTDDVKNRSTDMPSVLRHDKTRLDDGNSVGDEEPGPYDDDGLPENAKRRVPS